MKKVHKAAGQSLLLLLVLILTVYGGPQPVKARTDPQGRINPLFVFLMTPDLPKTLCTGERKVLEYSFYYQKGIGEPPLKRFPMSLRFIREIHEKLMQSVLGGNLTPGEFRRTQNWIGATGSTLATAAYVPPPVDEMNLAFGNLEKFIHTSTDVPILARAAMIHYQFEAIHPFLDGNGGVGRLLMALLLAEWQVLPQPLLNLSVYFERYRQEYYDHLLAVSQRGDWEAWLRFFLRGVSAQAQDSVARMERLETTRTRYQSIVDSEKNSERMGAVVDFLFGRPIFNAKQLAKGVDMPFKTARQYIEKLVQVGIVREVTGYARNQIYRADEIFKALDSIEV